MATITTVNPATGQEIEEYFTTQAREVDGKLDRARSAFEYWRTQTFDQRSALLNAVARTLRDRQADLARIATIEMGKPIAQAMAELEKCAWCCEYFAENAHAFLREEPVATNASKSYVAFRPLGVVLAVMPWNFPYWQVFRAAAPALMAGNAMVLKHASNVTHCALEIENVFRVSGAPDGLFSTLILKNDAIADLVRDPRIVAATLTGSEGAGMSIASAAGGALKRTVLELGGSDPFIVLADANLEKAVEVAITSRFQNNGQSCIAAKRFIVESPLYDDFVDRFAKAAAAQKIGDPLDESVKLGPVARDDLRESLGKQVAASARAGARIVVGGKPLDRPGFFYEATMLADVKPGMPVFSEETFGPAAAVTRANGPDEAITFANDSTLGLGATIFSADVERAAALAARIESGSVFINGMMASDPRLPFGGVKKSGYGRELSHFGMKEFVNTQTIWIGPSSVR